ncbi:hypothetical protein ATR1_042d0053 [Acetobacter tropicalis]|uniref:Uncharacterized protein n=1 Tax=Acetobacter tropicalis TaxID=104102 RepID=A0A511FK96_9PROT|nr:hypothetical protein ATR1_042d0053 [Acetobacter tropicalis]GEL49642.1 hypothetical protein ATR01nite_07170 [Acetobacter tropicalis]
MAGAAAGAAGAAKEEAEKAVEASRAVAARAKACLVNRMRTNPKLRTKQCYLYEGGSPALQALLPGARQETGVIG